MTARRPQPSSPAVGSGTLRVLGLCTLGLSLPTETIPLAIEWVQAAPTALPGVALLLASQGLAALALVYPRQHRVTAWLLLALLTVGMSLAWAGRGDFDPVPYMVPGYWLLPLAVVEMRRQERRSYVRFTAIAALVMIIFTVATEGLSERVHVADLLWIVEPAVGIVLFGDALLALSRSRRLTAARREQAVLNQSAVARAVLDACQDARALVNATQHALRNIVDVGHWPTEARQLAVEDSRTASLAVLDANAVFLRHHHPVQVEELVAVDPALTHANGIVRGRGPELPASVGRAIAGATHEALTNVARHAHANNCWVWVRTRAEGVRVEIRDAGRGFNPLRRVVDRLGADAAIVQQLDDVGGVAEIASSPGRGTSVTLTWPRPAALDETVDWAAAPDRVLRQALALTAWPTLIAGLLMTFLASPDLTRPGRVVVAVLVATVMAAVITQVLASRRPTNTTLAVAVAVAFLTWGVNIADVRTPPPNDYYLWAGWASSALIRLAVLSTRRGPGIALTVAWTLAQCVGLMTWGDPWRDLWDHSFVVLTGAGGVLSTLLILVLAQRTVAQEAEVARTNSLLRAATARLQHSGQAEFGRTQDELSDALQLLTGIAEGGMDPVAPEAGARALELSRRLAQARAERIDGANLLSRLFATHRPDWQLTHGLAEDSSAALAEGSTLVEVLGQSAHESQQVTLTAGTGRTLAVVADATPEQRERWTRVLRSLEGTVDESGGATRLALTTQPSR